MFRVCCLLSRVSKVFILVAIVTGWAFSATLTLTDAQLFDRIKGGLVAKNAGGALCGEFELMAPSQNRTLPAIASLDILDCANDDTPIMVSFINTLVGKMGGTNGVFTATMQDYAAAFKKTTFGLFCGNVNAHMALDAGWDAPYCGGTPRSGVTYEQESCGTGPACENIDWQIECQWIGWATPGLPTYSGKIDSLCGHVISYAEGWYSGRFFNVVGSLAPLYTDVRALFKDAQTALPNECFTRKNIDAIISYRDNNPTKTYWDCFQWGFNSTSKPLSLDGDVGAKTNLAIVVIAVLYCNNDINKAALYAACMGNDADNNGEDACAIFGSMVGYSGLPAAWRTRFEQLMPNSSNGCTYDGTGASPAWTTKTLLDQTVNVAKKAIIQAGGTYANGTYTIPVQDVPSICVYEKAGLAPQSVACSTPGQTEVSSNFEIKATTNVRSVLKADAYNMQSIWSIDGRKLGRTESKGVGVVFVNNQYKIAPLFLLK